jgi:8-oxo-dGTP diphosphatase
LVAVGGQRRIAAYGVCRDEGGRVLLTRASERAALPGLWQVPGGGIEHGEHPADAVVREFAEETGLTIAVTGLRAVVSDVLFGEHTDRIVYDVGVRRGTLRHEMDGTTDLAAWITPAELPGLPLMPFTAELFGVPADPVPVDLAEPESEPAPAPSGGGRPARGQRFAAYGLVTDPAGRVLLTLIADGYPGAGKWHLPGGGTDHGEQPESAFLRELAEEADQVGRVTGLLAVAHRRNASALGPEGYPVDFHSVWALYRARVEVPTPPRVTEAAGSTRRAAWFAPDDAARLDLTAVAAEGLARLRGPATLGR